MCVCLFIFVLYISDIISGYVEKNLGLEPGYLISFSFFHWNTISIASRNFIKVSLLRAYNSIY